MNPRPKIDEAQADVLGVDQAIGQSAVQFSGGTEPAALIDHVLTRYHAVHRAQLPDLICMAQRIEAVHRENPLVPAGLADLLETMQQELLSHMEKEEAILFPMLQAGGNPFVRQPIAMMRAEHVDHGAMLEKLAEIDKKITNDDWKQNDIQEFMDRWGKHIINSDMVFNTYQKEQELDPVG